jgi:outer membrane protein TolC
MAQSYAYEQTKLAIASASRGIEQAEANVIMDVKKAMRQRNRAEEKIRLQEEQIKTAQGELHLAKVKFDRGMADNFNVIQAEKSLRRAELGYWTARIDHVVSEYQMLSAMGLLIDKPHLR